MMNRNSQGIALVSVLLIVALCSILAAGFFRQQQLDLRRSLTSFSAERAYQYALGLEHLAVSALRQDRESSGPVDSRTEPWANSLPVLDLDEGRLTGRLVDLDGRFNLNNLIVDNQVQPQEQERFKRLLEVLGLDPAIANATVDWIDQDLIAQVQGAEDPAYSLIQPSYRTANRALTHISEIRMIAGVNQQVYAALRPHVTVLPPQANLTRININTASVPVLMALEQGITRSVAETLHQQGNARFESVNSFLEHPGLAGLNIQQLTPVISVGSRYFEANAIIEIGGVLQQFHSLIEQSGRDYQVIYRARGVSGIELPQQPG